MVDHWQDELLRLEPNKWEYRSLIASFEAMRRLIVARDDVEDARDVMAHHGDRAWGFEAPTSKDQSRLYEATKRFMDEFYSTFSALAGVVTRFSGAFGAQVSSENAKFLKWLQGRYQSDFNHGMWADLERARLFRAMLAHPQSFPAHTWATSVSMQRPLIHVVLHGDFGRGTKKIPPGAQTDHEFAANLDDWQFPAPDEVSVANCTGNAMHAVLADVAVELSRRSTFRTTLTYEAAFYRTLLLPHLDASELSRKAPSKHDDPEIMPPVYGPQ